MFINWGITCLYLRNIYYYFREFPYMRCWLKDSFIGEKLKWSPIILLDNITLGNILWNDVRLCFNFHFRWHISPSAIDLYACDIFHMSGIIVYMKQFMSLQQLLLLLLLLGQYLVLWIVLVVVKCGDIDYIDYFDKSIL